MFICFDRMYERDGHTDTQTDTYGRIALCGKNTRFMFVHQVMAAQLHLRHGKILHQSCPNQLVSFIHNH